MLPLVSRRCNPQEMTSQYHRDLIDATAGDCAMAIMNEQIAWLVNLASSISADQVDRVHPPYGWTIRQVVEHCADAERVFGYRMLRFAAGDPTELPGWDENFYAEQRFGLGNFDKLIEEVRSLRQSNLLLLRRLSPRCWDHTGITEGNRVTVRALAWLAAGHLQHHLQIVEKRIGVRPSSGEPQA
jgi:hypothetical protein